MDEIIINELHYYLIKRKIFVRAPFYSRSTLTRIYHKIHGALVLVMWTADGKIKLDMFDYDGQLVKANIELSDPDCFATVAQIVGKWLFEYKIRFNEEKDKIISSHPNPHPRTSSFRPS